jgi:hypothetical protein
MRDLPTRMEYIVRMATGDNLQSMERAFFVLYKTAQSEFAESSDGCSVLQYMHFFHGTVDTTWWTKLFYCMAIEAVAGLPYFLLTDTMKIKLWTFSSIVECEPFVRNALRKCTLDVWCVERRWGADHLDFTAFMRVIRLAPE